MTETFPTTRNLPPSDCEIDAFAKAIGYEPTESFRELVRRVVKRFGQTDVGRDIDG